MVRSVLQGWSASIPIGEPIPPSDKILSNEIDAPGNAPQLVTPD
jgi:hypothetical protein